jgi:hypothetical protein
MVSYLGGVLQKRTSNTGVAYYASARLEAIGVRHAFSTRRGGISPPPFDSLNLGNPNGAEFQDDYKRIWANYALLLMAVDCLAEPPLRVHQTHGSNVAVVQNGQPFDTASPADAIVSRDGQRPISVRTADCVPVLLSSQDGAIVAAIHAGWRGIVAGIVPATVRRILAEAADISADSLIAAIGPCIGADAFEVGPDVLSEFERVFGPDAPIRHLAAGKGKADLRAAARLQLLHCGLDDDCIDTTDRCTVTHADEFFSHRRDQGVTGRMAAVIAASTL